MAGMQIEVAVEGITELVRQVNDPTLIGEPVAHLFTTAVREGAATARDAARSSRIAQSIIEDPQPMLGRIASTLPQPRANVLERGRKPDSTMPPVDVVAAWAAAKGIDAGAAFPIARAIARRGTKGRFFMRAARAHVRQIMPDLVREATREIVARWGRSL